MSEMANAYCDNVKIVKNIKKVKMQILKMSNTYLKIDKNIGNVVNCQKWRKCQKPQIPTSKMSKVAEFQKCQKISKMSENDSVKFSVFVR